MNLDLDDTERALVELRNRFGFSLWRIFWLGIALLTLAAAVMPSLVAAQALSRCELGKPVDDRGIPGTIIGERDGLCLIKYKDGQTQRWVSAKDLASGPPAGTDPTGTTEGVKTLRPTIVNRLVYRADALGHIVITAKVNGAPVQFLVDTGATRVSLTSQDANAAGLKRSDLTFDQTVHTGNGPVHANRSTRFGISGHALRLSYKILTKFYEEDFRF